jgi:hypothetical protein
MHGRVRRSLNVTPAAGEGREGSDNIAITLSTAVIFSLLPKNAHVALFLY